MDNNEEKSKNQLKNQKKREKKKQMKQLNDELAKQVEQSIQVVKNDDEEYQNELTWCIKQLKLGLTQNLSQDQYRESIQVLEILESDKVPIIKKRMTMKQIFGDYRKLMKQFK